MDLLSAYNVAVDALDVDGWAACFTPDGVFAGAYDTFQLPGDTQRFAEHARELEAGGMPRLRHFLSNVRIEVDGDSAVSHCFFLIVATPSVDTSSIAMVGEYDDVLRRVDGRWLFERRTVNQDGAAPAASGARVG